MLKMHNYSKKRNPPRTISISIKDIHLGIIRLRRSEHTRDFSVNLRSLELKHPLNQAVAIIELQQDYRSTSLPPKNPFTPCATSIQTSYEQDDDSHEDNGAVASSQNDNYVAIDADADDNGVEHPATNLEIPIQGSEDQLAETSTEGSERASNSGDEESPYDFVSERSFHSEDNIVNGNIRTRLHG
jgi:hypothetical protein